MHCVVLCSTVWHHPVCCAVQYRGVLCNAVLCCAALCCVVLCFDVLCSKVQCYAPLCCAVHDECGPIQRNDCKKWNWPTSTTF